MKSQWYELKEQAVALRKTGMSMTVIEQKLTIPRSTLSGWFRDITLTEEQRQRLLLNKQAGWKKARQRAQESHRARKALRLLDAKKQALQTLERIELSDEVLDLAFAMLYIGEGSKKGSTSLASSDPKILRFVLSVLKRNYGITSDMVRCELHLRMDQNEDEAKEYWGRELKLQPEAFRYIAHDRRSLGKTTYDHYNGVCVLYCGSIAIQRKLIFLYTLFCDKVASLDLGD